MTIYPNNVPIAQDLDTLSECSVSAELLPPLFLHHRHIRLPKFPAAAPAAEDQLEQQPELNECEEEEGASFFYAGGIIDLSPYEMLLFLEEHCVFLEGFSGEDILRDLTPLLSKISGAGICLSPLEGWFKRVGLEIEREEEEC